jgi:hemerythrin-like domain-containing protein
MERHPALVSLSRDHHDGLLLAIRLQQGDRALLRLWSHDPFWQAKHVVQFYDEHLIRHFAEEEETLFPFAMNHLGEQSNIVDRLLGEHGQLTGLVRTLRTPGSKELPPLLREFGRILEGHIRCEERELFPLCERLIPKEVWRTIERKLRR